MGKIDYKFLNLTFISSEEEIKRQITNTAIFFFLEEKFNEVVELSELLESTQYGYNTSALSSGENKFLRISDIKDGKVNWDTVPFCDCTDEKSYLLYQKDILVARTGGTTGKSFLINNPPVKSVFAGYLIRLRANKKLLPEFLNLFLNSYAYWSQISEMKSGSAQPNVNAEKLKQLLIPYCSVDLQKEILSLLNDFKTEKKIWKGLLQTILDVQKKFKKNNEVIELLTTQKTLITHLRQSILQEAVQGKLVKQNKNDEPASELLKRIKAEKEKLIKQGKLKKEKPLPPISQNDIPYLLPEGWVWCRLGEIVLKMEYGTSEKSSVNNDVPVLGMGNIQEGKLVLDKLKYVSKSIKDLPKLYLKKHDLIFNRTNSFELVGKSAIYVEEDNEFTLASYLIRVAFPLSNVSAEYVVNYINSAICRRTQIEPQITQQTGQANFSGGKLKEILFPLPPLPEQKYIVEKINQLMQHCDELEQQVHQSITYAQQLMQAVLGEVFEKKEKKHEAQSEELRMVAESEIT